jgi:hypothetical protein
MSDVYQGLSCGTQYTKNGWYRAERHGQGTLLTKDLPPTVKTRVLMKLSAQSLSKAHNFIITRQIWSTAALSLTGVSSEGQCSSFAYALGAGHQLGKVESSGFQCCFGFNQSYQRISREFQSAQTGSFVTGGGANTAPHTAILHRCTGRSVVNVPTEMETHS